METKHIMYKALLLVTLTLVSQTAMGLSYTLEIKESELQEKLSAMMPMEKKKYFLRIVFSNPKVDLIEGRNRIDVFCHVKVMAPGGLQGTGDTEIQGAVRYVADKGEFFLDDPTVIKLDIDKLPDKYTPKIKELAQHLVQKTLAKRPVYRLKDNNIKHKLAKSVLKSVTVKNQTLLVELSVF